MAGSSGIIRRNRIQKSDYCLAWILSDIMCLWGLFWSAFNLTIGLYQETSASQVKCPWTYIDFSESRLKDDTAILGSFPSLVPSFTGMLIPGCLLLWTNFLWIYSPGQRTSHWLYISQEVMVSFVHSKLLLNSLSVQTVFNLPSNQRLQ